MKQQIKNPLRQKRVRNEAINNVECTVCRQVFSNHAAALDHAWSIENPVDSEEFNYCAHQEFQTVQWFESQVPADYERHELVIAYRAIGRLPHFETYEPILDSDGKVAIKPEGGDWVWTTGQVKKAANKNPKMGLIYHTSLD